jgi:hypothetical protein
VRDEQMEPRVNIPLLLFLFANLAALRDNIMGSESSREKGTKCHEGDDLESN